MAVTAVTSSSRISFQRLLQKSSGRRNHSNGFSLLLSTLPYGRNVSSSSTATRALTATSATAASLSSTMAASRHQKQQQQQQQQRRNLMSGGFTFAGPRELQDVLKTELLNGKKATEIADLWYTYHETKDNVVGLVLDGNDGKTILSRAATCPYFVQPVFRDDGFFMLLSEFQPPHHFLLAYLQDYKMDPHSATPLLTFSVFVDYADSQDTSLVRCDVLNANINVNEGRKVVQSLLDNYRSEVDYGVVKLFNQRPNAFDIDDHISRMNARWNSQDDGTTCSGSSRNGNDDASSSSSSTTITTP